MDTTSTESAIKARMERLEQEASALTQENLRKVTTEDDVARIVKMCAEWDLLSRTLRQLKS